MLSLCWAESTWRSKQSQWRRYLSFCKLYNQDPIPGSIDTICLYIAYLTSQVGYSTICNYISGVWSLHNYFGYPTMAKGTFLVSCAMKGARRLLGDNVSSAEPISPEQLVLMYRTLNYLNDADLLFWTATVLAYRCLLRKSHYTSSPHMLQVEDIEFTSHGLCLNMRSSKTIQYRERVNVILVVSSPNSILCPVRWLKVYLKRFRVTSGPLFLTPGKSRKPYSYRAYSKRFKEVLNMAGIKGKFSCHSLRRGCASFLSRLGLPLHDIKNYGDCRSLSVLFYLSGDPATRLHKDIAVARHFDDFC